MPLTLSVGSDQININNIGDLLSPATSSTLLSIADAVFQGKLNQQVSQFAKGSNAQLSYNGGNNSWSVGSFTFGLTGSLAGTVSILQAGDDIVTTYTTSFPTTMGDGLDTVTNSSSTGSIPVPANEYYVQVALQMTLTASAGGSGSIGAVSVNGTGTASGTYLVSFSKQVVGTATLGAALKVAFEGFVLPLHAETYSRLQIGDYLFHQFNATLTLGFGATYGVDKVLYSGQWKGDISSTISAPSVGASGKVEVKAGASFGTTFKYTGNFEATIWKTGQNTGRFHLYKATESDFNLNVGAEVTVIADPAVTLTSGTLQTVVMQALPGGTGTYVAGLIPSTWSNQYNSWANEIQTKITSWLKPFQQGQTQLQLAIERTDSKFLLTNYTFDLSAPGFGKAWNDAITGNFVAALAEANGGVTLDTGSGLEEFHTRKTSLTFNLFGLFNAEWDNIAINNLSFLYVGNNTFHLVQAIGRELVSKINKKGQEIDFYFAAEGNSGTSGVSIQGLDFYVVLTATQNQGFAHDIANLLRKGVTTGASAATATAMAGQMVTIAQQANATVTLELQFASSAYQKLGFSTYKSGKLLNPQADMANFAAFKNACAVTQSTFPANFDPSTSAVSNQAMDWAMWSSWNVYANEFNLSTNEVPSGAMPNRRDPGTAAVGESFLGDEYETSELVADGIANALQGASDFMNLCEDLVNLQNLAMNGTATWKQLIGDLGKIVNADLPSDFIQSTGLALMNQMAGSNLTITGPSAAAAQEAAIKVQLRFA